MNEFILKWFYEKKKKDFASSRDIKNAASYLGCKFFNNEE